MSSWLTQWLGLGVVIGGVSLATGACKQGPTSEFDTSGFRNPDVGLFVPYVNSRTQALVEGDWTVDNYYVTPRGQVKPKTGPGWEATREFDWNNDGTIQSWERQEDFIYDLKLRHVRDNGVIWLKVHPVHPRYTQKKLTVLLNNYGDSLGGNALFAQASLFMLETGVERQFTSFRVDEGPLTVDGHDAYAGTIEVAEVAKLQQDPNHRDSKVRIVFAKYARLERPDESSPFDKVVYQGSPYDLEVKLLVVGYHNTSDHFDEHLEEFERFVQRVRVVGGQRLEGFREEPVAVSTPAPEPSGDPAETAAPPSSADGGTPLPAPPQPGPSPTDSGAP